jgi:hypothetical protein
MLSRIAAPALLVLVGIIFLTGCASSIPAGNKPKVAPERSDRATIYVIEDIGGAKFLGASGLVTVSGIPLGPLSARQYTWFYAEPGKLKLSMNDPSIKSRKMSAQIFDVAAGKRYFIIYKIETRKGDGQLLADIFSKKAKELDVFDPEDLSLVSEEVGLSMIEFRELVGNAASN